MKKHKKKLIFLAVIIILTAYIGLNTNSAEIALSVNEEESNLDIDKMDLKITAVEFPFGIYYSKGNVNMENDSLKISKFKKHDLNDHVDYPLFKLNVKGTYEDIFYDGNAKITGDIFKDSQLDIEFYLSTTNPKTGQTYGRKIYATKVQ